MPRLTQVEFANGAVMLTTPKGYCIDTKSVRREDGAGFAIIARCDVLGVEGFFATRSLALITVTVGATNGAMQPNLADLEQTVGKAEILKRSPATDPPMLRVQTSSAQVSGASEQMWRAAFALNGHMVALSMYDPEDGRSSNGSGVRLLEELTRRTRAASQHHAPVLPDASQARALQIDQIKQ
ncbi:MAG: hypothetical protein GJ676_17605 [Rhodobacteraceae bacterium]|nr:hypothetical protein [Paracoccaceae bacterium]